MTCLGCGMPLNSKKCQPDLPPFLPGVLPGNSWKRWGTDTPVRALQQTPVLALLETRVPTAGGTPLPLTLHGSCDYHTHTHTTHTHIPHTHTHQAQTFEEMLSSISPLFNTCIYFYIMYGYKMLRSFPFRRIDRYQINETCAEKKKRRKKNRQITQNKQYNYMLAKISAIWQQAEHLTATLP